MQYRGSLTIPSATAASSPATLTLPVCYGVLRRWILYFPPGQAGMVYAQVWYKARQILPTSPGEALRGDDLLVDMPEAYPLHDAPLELELRGWAPDTTYDHEVYFLFYVERDTVLLPTPLQAVELPGG